MTRRDHQGWTITLTGPDQNDCLQTLINNKAIYKYMIAAQDVSANENFHIHVLLWMDKRIVQTSLMSLLCELNSKFINAIQYMEPVKSMIGITAYILKKQTEGFDVSAHGEVPKSLQKKIDKESEKELSPFQMLAAKAYATRDECIADFQSRKAEKFYLANLAIMAAINEVYPYVDESPQFKPDQFNVPLLDFSNGRTKLIVGPTNIGKTQWAKAHFAHPLVITDSESYSRFDPDKHDGIVIDDMSFRKNDQTRFLHHLDMRQASERRVCYKAKMIPAGVPRIFTINKQQLFWPEQADPETIKAWKTRCEIIMIEDNGVTLFDKNNKPTIHYDCEINTARYSTHPSGLDYEHTDFLQKTFFNESGFPVVNEQAQSILQATQERDRETTDSQQDSENGADGE